MKNCRRTEELEPADTDETEVEETHSRAQRKHMKSE